MRPQLAVSLPSHIKPERFERIVLTAVNNDPDLISADRRSLFNACMKAAQDGLLPDKREGALVIFKDKTGKKLVQWMPMVFGLIKKIRQSGEIDSIGARIVYQKEIDDGRFRFVIEEGKEKLYHDPMLWGDRGEKVLVYAYARFKETGTVEYAPLHRKDVEKRRKVSRAGDRGPWVDWEDEMWLKTAIRAIAKRLPLSAELLDSIQREAEPTEFDRLRHAAIAQLSAPEPQEPGLTPEEFVDRAITVVNGTDDITELDDVTAMLRDEADRNFTAPVLLAQVNNQLDDLYQHRRGLLSGGNNAPA